MWNSAYKHKMIIPTFIKAQFTEGHLDSSKNHLAF